MWDENQPPSGSGRDNSNNQRANNSNKDDDDRDEEEAIFQLMIEAHQRSIDIRLEPKTPEREQEVADIDRLIDNSFARLTDQRYRNRFSRIFGEREIALQNFKLRNGRRSRTQWVGIEELLRAANGAEKMREYFNSLTDEQRAEIWAKDKDEPHMAQFRDIFER